MIYTLTYNQYNVHGQYIDVSNHVSLITDFVNNHNLQLRKFILVSERVISV
jgi:hypothetical protein